MRQDVNRIILFSASISAPTAIGEEGANANDEPLNEEQRLDAKHALAAVCEDPAPADASSPPPGRDEAVSSNANFFFVGKIPEREEVLVIERRRWSSLSPARILPLFGDYRKRK
jgi:hypothetical protein